MDAGYEKLLQDIFQAYFDARKNKRNTHSQLAFEIDLESHLVALAEEIYERRYKPSPSFCFIVEYPAKREIFASGFRDRVVHHLLYNYISKIFERLFIADCYACRKGMGTHYGIQRLEHHIRSCTRNYTRRAWVLKLDIRGYFMSIDKNILHRLIRQQLGVYYSRLSITDGRGNRVQRPDLDLIFYLVEQVIFDDPTVGCHYLSHPRSWVGLPRSKSLFHLPENIGLPIGNLTSQLFSNVYLTPFDNFVKRELGAEHYGRYVDDFYIVHEDRMLLRSFIRRINDFLQSELHLELHPNKIYLQDTSKGVPFLGAYVKPYRRYTVQRTTSKIKKSLWDMNRALEGRTPTKSELEEIRTTLNSYMGHLRHFNEYRMKTKILSKCPNITKYGRFDAHYHKFILSSVNKEIKR